MDIEGPSSPIRSARDFAIHIATVTIGILIALGLEALIESYHNQTLVEHTRHDFKAEFAGNRREIVGDLQRSAKFKAQLEQQITYAHARLTDKPATFTLLPPRYFLHVQTAAWGTATATQALVHLSLAEAGMFSRVQSDQTALNTLQDRAEAQWFELAAFNDPEHLDRAATAAEMSKLTIAYAYLVSARTTEQHLLSSYDHALQSLDQAAD